MASHEKIMVVRSDVIACMGLVRGLEALGYDAHGIRDSDTAIACLDGTFDGVVTDLALPGLDGIGLLREAMRRNPCSLRIALSGGASKETVRDALNHGVHYLLEEPFTAQQLSFVIATLREESRVRFSAEIRRIFNHRLASMALNERERIATVGLLKGLPNKEIAMLLGITDQSAKNFVYRLYKKVGVTSRSELFHLLFPV